jgi:murein DD-endopeptidase MepM/ murein hydrolase activator NlpD
MSGIVVPQNTIAFSNQERNTSAATTTQKQPAQTFQDLLSTATRLENNKSINPAQDQPSADNNHTVVQGDTLSEIVAAESQRMGITPSLGDLYTMVDQIASLNHLTNADTIFPGQEINLTAIAQPISGPAPRSVSEAMTVTSNVDAPPQETGFRSPVNGRITSLFGMRTHPVLGETRHHDGIDISQPDGSPVKPLSSGVVTFSGNNGGYGLMVEVDHGNGLISRYAHLSKLSVHNGEQISPEQIIGQVGQTGMTTGPHLHLEILRQNSPIDPLTVLNRQEIETGLLLFAEARKTHRM